MISGRDHWIRGLQAVAMALSMPLGRVFPQVNHLLEALTGASISGLGIVNGLKALRGKESNDGELSSLEKSVFGKFVYKGMCVFNGISKLSTRGKSGFPRPKFDDLLKLTRGSSGDAVDSILDSFAAAAKGSEAKATS